MAWLLMLGAVFGSLVLLSLGVLPWWAAIVLMFVALLLASWNLDRQRRPGARSPVLDPNSANFYAPMDGGWEVPTAYIDHPTGGGPPPGVEQYDSRAADRSNAGRERL